MHCTRKISFFIIASITATLIISCSGTGELNDPCTPTNPDSMQSSPDFMQSGNVTQSEIIPGDPNTHAIWGMWWVYIDPDNSTWEIVPARDPAIHANVRKFLEDGAPCSDCFQITNFVSNPDGTKSIDIRITHPWPGLDTFTGFDVRAIAMWNGSVVWPASGLRTQDPDSTDGYVLNADGYTTFFNPTDFPEGSDIPLFSYTTGSFATPTAPDSTLNPYIDYFTDENRHMFRAGQSVTKTWEIRMPSDGPFVLGYAIDSSWELPDPNPPENLPDDFSIHANKPEPYLLEVEQEDPLGVSPDTVVNIVVTVWDWQSNPGGVWIECPELWAGKKNEMMVASGPDYVMYYVPVSNQMEAPIGEYRALIAAGNSLSTPPPGDFTTYTFFDITVEAIGNQPPVAAAEASEYSVYTGDEIQFTSLSTDPDGPGDIAQWKWDFENDDEWDSNLDHPTWSYDVPGVYFVDHEVTDQGGLYDDLEPDELLEINVMDKCCENPPVAIIEGPKDVITEQVVTLTSGSYDPDGDECMAEVLWDLDGDGIFEQAGDEVVISWDEIGTYHVFLKAVDVCGLMATTMMEINVHVGVTQPEDDSYKTIGTRYSYVSIDMTAPDASYAVDMSNPEGPWDFTLLGLVDMGNYRAILGQDHPEVASFKDDFPTPYHHFYKTEGIYNMVSGAVYVAEAYASDPDRLLWVGIHEDEEIGSVPFSPVMQQPYPFWIFSHSYYIFGFPPLFSFSHELNGWGEGVVSVPYNGMTNVPCVVTQCEVIIESITVTGSGIIYEWSLDDGTVVAIVAAINTDGDINYDTDTGEITGVATFNALNTVEPY